MDKSFNETSSTPAVSQNGFTFQDGQFFVEGDPYRHPRMDARELYDLLTFTSFLDPAGADAAKAQDGKHQLKTTHKDRKAEFYSAQLAHYGLKVYKTREPAKKHLLIAFANAGGNGKTLPVPAGIVELESSLRNEWLREHGAKKGKMKASQIHHKIDETPSTPTPSDSTSKMTKADMRRRIDSLSLESARTLLLNFLDKIPSFEEVLAADIFSNTQNDHWAPKSVIGGSTIIPSLQLYPSGEAPRTKQTARTSRGMGRTMTSVIRTGQNPDNGHAAGVTKYRTKQTARRGSGRSMSSVNRAVNQDLDDGIAARSFKPRTKQTARRGMGWSAGTAARGAHLDSGHEHATGTSDSRTTWSDLNKVSFSDAMDVDGPDFMGPDALGAGTPVPPRTKQTARRTGHRVNGHPLFLWEWAGEYLAQSKALAENWPDLSSGKELSFEIYPSSTSSHFWASFNFGIISGIMRSIGPLPSITGGRVFVEWRGYEGGEGEMTFSKTNCGILRFYGNGHVQGNMRGGPCGSYYFEGTFDRTIPKKSESRQQDQVRRWKREWRGINHRNYEVKRKSRWGGWGGEEVNESAYESDTTNGDHAQEEINFDEFESDSDWEEYRGVTDEED